MCHARVEATFNDAWQDPPPGRRAPGLGKKLLKNVTRTLAAVGRQFRDLVLKADVGIIDVAWTRKQAETDKVNDLIREQQRRSSELESEFAEFLKE